MAENIQLAGLVVDLLLNTASFEAGSTKAQRIANKAAKDIDREFRALQGALSGVLSRLGPIGATAAASLDQIGSAATKAMEKLGGLGKGIGLIGAGAAGLGVAAAAASVGIIGIAAHAAEGAAKLEDLAHSTGMSVEALSKFTAVGHMIAPDVDIDAIAKSIGRMNRQIVEAASASATTITPFQRMGVSIRDASGQMKTGEEIFAEIGDKFFSMQDGAIKSGLAMQIFGRSGASIIPILDEGGERLRRFTEIAEKSGAIIGTETAEAAHKFKENIGALEITLQGVENRIMEAMLPAITELANRMVQFFSETTPQREKFIHDLTDMAKAFLGLAVVGGEALRLIANNLGAIIDVEEILRKGGTFTDAGKRTAQWAKDTVDILKGVPAAMNLGGAAKTPFDQLDEMKDRLREFDRMRNPGNINLESTGAKSAQLTIEAQIKKLQGQADAEGLLAKAISEESSATIENIAHAEALKQITEMNAIAQKEGVSVTKAQAAAIELATLRLEAYKAALKVNKDLQENIDKTKLAAEGTMELAKAYGQGAIAIEAAQEKLKLSPLADAVNDLQELHDKLGKLPITGKAAELFNNLGDSLKQAQDKLSSAAIQEHAKAMADAALASAKLGDNLQFETAELEKQITATLQGTDALREFNAKKQIDVFVHEHPGVLTPDQIAGLRQQAATMAEDEEKLQVVQKFRSENNVRSIADEINELTKYHDVLVRDSNDELVYQGKMHDLLQAQQRAWDELLLKTNDTGAGVRAFFDEMAFDGQTAAERIHDSLTSTFNTLEDTFSRFVSGQKVSWKELENQILGTLAKQSADVLLRGGITAIRGAVVGKLPGQQQAWNEKIPGAGRLGVGGMVASLFGVGGKTATPGSSPTNPIYTKSVDLLPGTKGGTDLSSLSSLALSKAPSSISSLLSGLTTILPFMAAGGGHVAGPGTSTSDSIPAMLSAGEYVLKADTVKRIGKTHLDAINAGHPIARFAQGGAVTPGGSYLASERRPFAFTPQRIDSVVPRMSEADYGDGGGITVVNHFHDTHDMNTFKASESQVAGNMQRALYGARRNG